MPQSLLTMIEILKNQGFSFLLMGAMLWYLNNQLEGQKADMRELKIQVDICNKANQDILINHINKNTRALEMYEFNHRPPRVQPPVPPLNNGFHE